MADAETSKACTSVYHHGAARPKIALSQRRRTRIGGRDRPSNLSKAHGIESIRNNFVNSRSLPPPVGFQLTLKKDEFTSTSMTHIVRLVSGFYERWKGWTFSFSNEVSSVGIVNCSATSSTMTSVVSGNKDPHHALSHWRRARRPRTHAMWTVLCNSKN